MNYFWPRNEGGYEIGMQSYEVKESKNETFSYFEVGKITFAFENMSRKCSKVFEIVGVDQAVHLVELYHFFLIIAQANLSGFRKRSC